MMRRAIPFVVLLAALLFPGIAGAGCPNPNAPGGESVEGAQIYNADHKTMQFCDGTTWWAMKSGGGLPACAEGDTIVLTSSGWGCGGGSGFLTFTDLTDQATSTQVTSNILQVGLSSSSSISISGDGSPEYRICADDACSSETQTWASTAGTINSGEFLQLRLTSSASNSTMVSTTVVVGTESDQWDVTTGGPAVAFVADDGDASDGAGSTSDYGLQTSTGPQTFVLLGYRNATANVSSADWNGNAGSIVFQYEDNDAGCALLYWSGAQSGTLTANFDASVDGSAITVVSLQNVSDPTTPVGTDTDTGGRPYSVTVTSPGDDGIGLYALAYLSTDTISWSGGPTELSDFAPTEPRRFSAAYELGASNGADATPSGGSNNGSLCGVSLR